MYFDDNDDLDTPQGDKLYRHIGVLGDDGKITSQFGEGNLGIFRHRLNHVFTIYGDSIVFMRKKLI